MNAKNLIAPIAALAIAAAVLFGASSALSGTAQSREEAARNEIMGYMLPGRPASFTEEPYDGEDESIRRVFKAEDGYVLELETAGYAGPMMLWVGVTNEGRVSGLTVRDHGETFGLGRGGPDRRSLPDSVYRHIRRGRRGGEHRRPHRGHRHQQGGGPGGELRRRLCHRRGCLFRRHGMGGLT